MSFASMAMFIGLRAKATAMPDCKVMDAVARAARARASVVLGLGDAKAVVARGFGGHGRSLYIKGRVGHMRRGVDQDAATLSVPQGARRP
jgi:hypothetical protein